MEKSPFACNRETWYFLVLRYFSRSFYLLLAVPQKMSLNLQTRCMCDKFMTYRDNNANARIAIDQICAHGDEIMADVCHGDSGSPLVCLTTEGNFRKFSWSRTVRLNSLTLHETLYRKEYTLFSWKFLLCCKNLKLHSFHTTIQSLYWRKNSQEQISLYASNLSFYIVEKLRWFGVFCDEITLN